MPFIADLHIHSHYSIATSKELRPESLDMWARIKGISLVGTGDFTHPGWLEELKEKLEPAEQGLFRIKKEFLKESQLLTKTGETDLTRFMLTAEISNIYKKNGKVRKVHNVILAPDFETVEKIQAELERLGFNIRSDGRPILGMDSRDLLELVLNCSDNIFFIPAHIWTPWFSALGAKSGFESIRECYDDLSEHIYAVETGLSSDPPMNWLCSFLDEYTLIANSDAHSPEKLGRNANLINTELSYDHVIDALKTGDPAKFSGTIDFFPQEGKYHYAGHRKCNVCLDPAETTLNRGICPVCNKPLTMGVLNRVVDLSDRDSVLERKTRAPFYSLIPLKEILSEIMNTGPSSKKIEKYYQSIIQKAGSEFNILLNHSIEEVRTYASDILTEAIRRMRNREVIVKEGFDGEFGHIKVFSEQELISFGTPDLLSVTTGSFEKQAIKPVDLISFDLKSYISLKTRTDGSSNLISDKTPKKDDDLNPDQLKAVEHLYGPALVIAGPGTGKTRVLIQRIINLIKKQKVNPKNILAITFTNKASGEIKERVKKDFGNEPVSEITISTFHSLGYEILKKYHSNSADNKHLKIVDEEDKRYLLSRWMKIGQKEIAKISGLISQIKQDQDTIEVTAEQKDIFKKYQAFLNEHDLFDLDDLIIEPVRLLETNMAIRKELEDQYQWILIDEYQDINNSQYRLIRLLSEKNQNNLFVIGDPNQAIYGFRGADVTFIKQFKHDYPEANLFNLKTSYRCSDQILTISREIIKDQQFGTSLLEGIHKGVNVKIHEEATDKSEAEFVARTIEEMIGGLRFFSMDSKISSGAGDPHINSLSDFAVLCRTSRQMKVIGKALNDHSIPYQAVTESSFFKAPQIRSIIDMINLGLHPDNILVKEKTDKNDLLHFFRSEELKKLVDHSAPSDLIPTIINRYFIDPRSINPNEQKKLLAIAKRFTSNEVFLKFALLGANIDTFQPDIENVNLMTLHASKGLEFKCVFIVGCEDGLLPYSIFRDQISDTEEEQRLLYVGMTRAKRYLYLTHAKKRFLMGQSLELNRSRFLINIEKELVDFSKGKRKESPPKSNQLELF